VPILDVVNLQKSYGSLKAVAGVTFSIEPGEVFGLLGPNGAGKSTTINIIATILPPDGGDVRVSGVPITRRQTFKRKIGFIPQQISLFDRLTARENLRLFGRLYDLSGDLLRDKSDALLAGMGLTDRADDTVQTYSGGMKRRLNIAAALLHDPDLILMDEPTAGVDPQARAYIFDVVERLAASGKAILYTTHYMEEAQRLCNRTAIIDHGRILAMGTLSELVAGSRTKRELIISAPNLSESSLSQFAAQLGGGASAIEDGAGHLNIAEDPEVLLHAAAAAQRLGIIPTALRIAEPNLETVFLELTGRALRD
jgi:ABC-2 type transport system ATP-binding protein